MRSRHGRRGRRRADTGSGRHRGRRSLRIVRPPTQDPDPRLAADRHRHRALAAAHSRRGVRGRADRTADPAGIPDQLQRSAVHTARHRRQQGIRRGGATLLPGPIDAGSHDGRGRPRFARSGGLPRPRQTRQRHLPRPGNLTRASDYAPRGHGDGAHVDSVPAQHAERRAGADDEVPEGSHGRHAQAGR